jgi:hypothetical protein
MVYLVWQRSTRFLLSAAGRIDHVKIKYQFELRRGMKLKKTILMALIASLAVSFGGSTCRVQAQDTPNSVDQASLNRLLNGTYSFLQGTSYYDYTSAAGTLTFDGHGGLTGVLDLNYDYEICGGMTLSGTYVVNSNRTASAFLSLISVNTANCTNTGNGATMNLSMSFGAKLPNAPVAFVNFAEMDQYDKGTYIDDFYNFAGVATLR